jgi:hypothetical protein
MVGRDKGGPRLTAGPPGNQVPLVCPTRGSAVEIAPIFTSITSLRKSGIPRTIGDWAKRRELG